MFLLISISKFGSAKAFSKTARPIRFFSIGDLHFHDLRGTAITMLTEAGAAVPEIAAVTGHSLSNASRILEVYLSRTRSLADAAIIKLDERRNRP